LAEKRLDIGRLVSWARIIFTLVIVVGAILYLYGLYVSSKDWRVEAGGVPEVGMAGYRTIRVSVPVDVYNPDGEVMAKLVYYRIIINGELAGDGLIPYLHLPSGWSTHTVTAEIDLARTGCGIAKALAEGDNITVRIEGYAMIDIKTIGGITWRTITVPYNITAGEVQAPVLDEKTRTFLQLLLLICDAPEQLADIAGLPQLPTLPALPTQQGALNVELTYRQATLTTLEVIVNLENTGNTPVTVTRIIVNNQPVSVDITLQPGEKATVPTGVNVPPGTTVTVRVESSLGETTVVGVAGLPG